MRTYLNFIVFFFALISNSQTSFNSENFTVSKADLETNTFKKDSTASAIILKEYGESYIDKNTFDLVFYKKVKLKILNRNGFGNANISIYLYNNDFKEEKVKDIIATTYNSENGKISKVKLEKNQIFEERHNENYTIVKFAMPNIKEGSVISYSYTTTSPFIYKYMPWRFQSEIPKLYSEYKTSIPANYEYNIKLVGDLKLAVKDVTLKKRCITVSNGGTADCTLSRYVIKDIPAFIEEDYMTTKDNYLSRIEYELKVFNGFDGTIDNITKTWKTTDKELKYDPNIGRQLKKGAIVKNLLNNEINAIKNPLDKAKAIYTFVQDSYTWNEEYNIFKDISLKKLIKTGSGNVSEINFLLYNLLKENGYDVTPVLCSTRSNGFPTKIYPVISDFNYVIIQIIIENKTYQLDATNSYLSFGQIPFRALNKYGRFLDLKNGSRWVDIKPLAISSKRYKVELSLNNDNTISGISEYKATGYHSLDLKYNYFKNQEEYKKEQALNENIIDHEIKVDTKNSNDIEEKITLEIPIETIGSDLYVNPFLTTFFDQNPFKLQERSYPIDFGFPDSYVYYYKLNYDSSTYKVEDIPKSIIYKLPNNTGTLALNTNSNKDNISIFLKFNFTEAIYNSNYYPYLKEYFNKIIEIQKNSLIVLKKK
ncbi:DUF3857 domain-containing protein [uncultured Lacinutrix sp.]|uniref:DUF3857 domain-containing protein n=1 Tax=uncultured Lacinutrix sp. TaxID=574032 RepID=UPI002612B993|nr:DUF3857 domain-containing protein [uncultured Lacinutrix sp.]